MNTQKLSNKLQIKPGYTLNKGTIFILFIVSILILILTSCDMTSKETMSEAAEEVSETKEVYNESKDNYNAEVENYKLETNEKIAENEKKLADYKIKVANDKSNSKKKYQDELSALEEKNAALKRQVNSFIAGDKVRWEAFKKQCSKEMINLHGDICNACGPQK